jgi:CBS domain-containing protein
MQIREAMSDDVRIASPNQTIRDAAILMAKIDAGILPVGDNDRLVGMISDRDIAVRAIALGKGPDTPVREVMSEDVKYCFEDDDVDDVAQNMADIKVRRLPVLNKSKRLVGIVSLGDLALTDGPANAGEALCGISEPGGAHSQSADKAARAR